MQERFERPARDSAPSDQAVGQLHASASVKVVEAEHRCEVPIDRRLAALSRGGVEHNHVVRGGAQPPDELRNIIDLRT